MHFKVTARTILQLGSELISSDAIAFYELIKNAFDAESKTVQVRIIVRLPHSMIEEYIGVYGAHTDDDDFDGEDFAAAQARVIGKIDREAPGAEKFATDVRAVANPSEFCRLLRESNYIIIKDLGEGMSLTDLDQIYLTIGTRSRQKQRGKNTANKRPVLGEKGLGRLSVMRLGEGLRVETTKAGETHFSLLEIDWTIFSHESDALLESIDITPKYGARKTDSSVKGTTIQINNLRSEWSIDKLRDIGRTQLSKFIDPFGRKNRDFISLWFNKQHVDLESIDKKLFQYAHASGNASLAFDDAGDPVFSGEVHYHSYDKHNTFRLEGTHLATKLDIIKYREALHSLGPFTVEIYWYNRKLLSEKEGVLDADYIKELVRTWGGGLMVYRDGFRVNPYGGPDDDWLELDRKALASGGYKMNRRQVVGKVEISSTANPGLLDQTNREGLRDNQEKHTLVTLLQFFIWQELKSFLDEIKRLEDQNLAALSLNEIEKRILTGQKQVRAAIEHLKKKYPQIKQENETLTIIEDVLEESSELFRRAKASADVLDDRLKTTIDLAGLGLMVDVVAHELNRSTSHALKTIDGIPSNELSSGLQETMKTLSLQLRTLKTRLKVLDPLGPSGRQQKVMTDIRKLVNETVEAHKAQFQRHNIHYSLKETAPKTEWKIKVVPGMLIQILENLINNSVYWIKQEQNVNKLSEGKIEVLLDIAGEKIFFTDNGPGIPRGKKEDIFRPFYTTKPPASEKGSGAGKGLGLYISREIAKYHSATLFLLDDNSKKINLNTFVLSLNNP